MINADPPNLTFADCLTLSPHAKLLATLSISYKTINPVTLKRTVSGIRPDMRWSIQISVLNNHRNEVAQRQNIISHYDTASKSKTS